ncbi:serine-rich adhesin for platelets-like isoform X2 [Biomphalaria glabrata]|uniref:Serine-rich adhesin for platelets-like isoform X2 n=1 Tax=Biomphalaria glabrata TaxID=6526 RepID=A0A9W3BKI2_BIOGL|nr:serine-rich adhesin for platelets-like isoform X2 [Biomphalaria glabrata]
MTMPKQFCFKFRNKRKRSRGLCDKQQILSRDREIRFGIDSPIACLDSPNSLSAASNVTEASISKDLDYDTVDAGCRNWQANIALPEQDIHTSSTMTEVDTYHGSTIRCNLPTVSETVPVHYSCSQSSLSNSSSMDITEQIPWKDGIVDSVFQRKFSRRNFIKFPPTGKIEEPDDASSFVKESDKASSCSDADTIMSDSSSSTRTSVENTETALQKHVSFLEDLSTSSSTLETRPRIHIRLMRARAASVSNISLADDSVVQETSFLASSTDNILSSSQNLNTTPNSDSSMKRKGYLKKIKTLFQSKSSKSLSNLMNLSNDQLSRSLEEIHFKQSRSRTSSSSSEVINDNSSDNGLKSTMNPVFPLDLNSGKGKVETASLHKSSIKVNKASSRKSIQKRVDEVIPEDEDSPENRFEAETSLVKSYSLLRSQSHDAATVNFSRIPSVRMRQCHLRFLYHFTTTLPADGTLETHAVKEATHIQPLKGGESVVTDVLSNKLVLFDSRGFPKVTFAVEAGSEPWATCVTPEGALAVTLKRQGCVSLWSTSGEPIREFGQPELSTPTGIQCDTKGRFIVADEEANAVLVFNKFGKFLSELSAPVTAMKENVEPFTHYQAGHISDAGSFFHHPRYICTTPDGHYVISDSANHCIKVFDPAFNFKFQFGSFGKQDGQFKFPYGVASDGDGHLYVGDHYNNRVSMFSPEGHFLEHVLTSQDGITRPACLAVMNSRLYVTHGDLRSNKVTVYHISKDHSKKVNPDTQR